jgi:hypothetical protein
MNRASTFTVPFGTYSLVGDILSNDSPPDVVVLHGAGRSGRHRFNPIRAQLLEHGISSLAFDMVGHGDTGGNLAESSLKDRTLQAESVIKHWKLSEPLSLIGASMSGYTAVSLTQYFNVKNLILFVPAMYSRRAYSLCFNDGFSKVIREQNSWFDSDAWDILNKFRGNLLLITAENDDIIPEDVVKKIFESATKSRNKFIHEVQGSPHQILSYLAERPQKFMEVIKQIISILEEGSEK